MRRSGKCVRYPPQRFFGDKLEDGREAAGGTWWTRRREVAEFAEEDKKVKERARLRIRGGGQEEKTLMHEVRSSMRGMRDG